MFFIYVQKQAMFEKTMSQTCRTSTDLEEKRIYFTEQRWNNTLPIVDSCNQTTMVFNFYYFQKSYSFYIAIEGQAYSGLFRIHLIKRHEVYNRVEEFYR
ncbi:hypothetical protein ADM90_10940 [Lysinibacillus macroides]|uniref:Uncharacterized protein n=1 Tax=Lysinibacillus macroides TaxID=33935 RepID=A0A0M9DKQ9_9BACI|nr:hypothetical protein ADM90_10940 [Lysinibacillus macroides]